MSNNSEGGASLDEQLRAALRRLDSAIYEEDVALALFNRARMDRQRAAAEVIALQKKIIDALRGQP